MGCRANVFVKDYTGSGVFLYTHWRGSSLPMTLRAALERGRNRWDDAQYLARIIFCDMVEGSERDETGYGISAIIGDNSHPILVVDTANKTLGLARDEAPTEAVFAVTIAEFVASPELIYGRYASGDLDVDPETGEGQP